MLPVMKALMLVLAVVLVVGCGGSTLDLTAQPELEKAIRKHLKETRGSMPTGELTKEDFDKVTKLSLSRRDLDDTALKEVAKLTRLKELYLHENQLTNVKGLENLTQLTDLHLNNNPALTKAQIDQLQKALPKCEIYHDASK